MRIGPLEHIHVDLLHVRGGKPDGVHITTGLDNGRRKRVAVLQQEAEQQIGQLPPNEQSQGQREASDIFHKWFLWRAATDALINGPLMVYSGIQMANHNFLWGILLIAAAANEVRGLIRAGEFKNAANTHWRRSTTSAAPAQQ